METKSWFKLMIIHLGLFILFMGITKVYADPWALAVGFGFLSCFLYCFTIWRGNKLINKWEQ